MNKITINKEELFELLDQDGTIEMSKMPTDHDYYLITSIVYKNNKTYRVNYESNNEDIFGEDFELLEVEPYQETVTKWRIKK